MSESKENESKEKVTTGQMLRLFGILAWTGGCGLLWFAWILAMANQPDMQKPGAEETLGLASCMVTGCVGGVWMMGLFAFLILYLLLRR